MQVTFIRPRTQGHGRRSIKRTMNTAPVVGSTIKWNDALSFTVASVDYSLNVTPGAQAPGKASASVTLR